MTQGSATQIPVRTSRALYVYTVLAMLLFKLKLVNWLKLIESALHFGKALTSIKMKHYETIMTMGIESSAMSQFHSPSQNLTIEVHFVH